MPLINKIYRLRHVYREAGVIGVFTKALRFFYLRQRMIISGRLVDPQCFPELSEYSPPDVQCVVLEKPVALDSFYGDIPPSFRNSAERLKERLAGGCILFLAKKAGADSPDKVIGYSLSQRGVFSALERATRISTDILFIHYIEVLPEYRRGGVTKAMAKARYAYCKANGITRTVTVGSTRNRLSQVALRRWWTSQRVGTVEKISILGGLYVWETPWEETQKALNRLTGADSNNGAILASDLSEKERAAEAGRKYSVTW